MVKTTIKPYKEVQYRIYAYTLPEVPSHEGYVKIGQTTRDAKTRVFEQVGTVGLKPKILFEKLARKADGTWFRDKQLHRYIMSKGFKKKDFNGKADEWFYFNGYLEKAEEITDEFIQQGYDKAQIKEDEQRSDYILRAEQHAAVEKTLAYYKSGKEPREFLWNAKPRFGKTLTTYDFIRKIKPTNVLIVTNRPAIANSWYDDFKKFIAWQEPHMKFVSETDALNGKAMTRKEFLEFIDTTTYENPAQITFISLQDLKGAKFAGGSYEKLEWVPGLEWDLLVIDEAHEGVDTHRTDIAFKQIKRKFTLHLSGTPFKALAGGKFSEEQIFNWSYLDEQEAKQSWDPMLGTNPYESLPTLNMFTYQMSKMIEEEVSEGLELGEDDNIDYAFDLTEFFRVGDNGRFVYEESVKKFLDNLASGKYPFAKEEYRDELNHTFWLLPRVNSAKALEKLLKKHPVFKEYKVVLAAGDGRSLQDNMNLEEEALNFKANTKSLDRVREAIKKFDKTITLSVGQLTTGVTVPEWTAVLMLNNIKSPSLYFQAAFRAQNPYEYEKDGKIYRKENAYIFDFSPDRTLLLYDEFANNLSGVREKTSDEREKNIKKLLNFFPVIAEDEDGSMHEIDASEVLTIPTRITSKEVVKRGFMSNLLFANISGIFSGHSQFKEILDKIPPEKNRRLEKRREIEIPDVMIDEDGDINIPNEVVIGRSKDLFGDKVFAPVEHREEILSVIDVAGEKEHKKTIKQIANLITESLSEGFDNLKDTNKLSERRKEQIEKRFQTSLENSLEEKSLQTAQMLRELEKEFETKTKETEEEKDSYKLQTIVEEIEKKKEEVKDQFVQELAHEVEEAINDVVEEEIKTVEEKKKKTTEDDVRDHLRGFARTIPAFLMAYGDENTTLSNFEENIEDDTFEELTSITKDEFRKLRDGFEYVTDEGETKKVPGLFNEVVFNASIKEFMSTKERLANYFDESLEEDIFDYIPPQKTNQIFTPRRVVRMMVDALEEENPNIFSDKNVKFADLYAKSGLYITEIVKKLNKGLKEEIPDQKERIKWILENQVYICAPNDIIYNIVKNFVFGNLDYVSTKNLKLADTMKLADEGKLAQEIYNIFGDDNLKFDVIIGNPPYQSEGKGLMARDEPIYHKFMEESYNIADKVALITPARFLFNAGQTPKKWNKKMLNDPHLKVVYYEQYSAKVFPDTDIKGGVAITYRDVDKDFGSIGTFTHYIELNSILKKVLNKGFKSFNELLYGKSSYKFTFKVYEENPELEKRVSSNEKKSISSNIFDKLPEIFFDEKQNNNQIQILGRKNGKRVLKWIDKDYVEDHPNLHKYKVILPATNGTGEFGETLSTPFVANPLMGYTQTFISFGSFDSKTEAENTLKYLKTKFLRAMLGTMKVTQHNQTREVWKNVPMQDFTNKSDIDWSKSISEIDQQLYKKYNLSESEIDFIESKVKEME